MWLGFISHYKVHSRVNLIMENETLIGCLSKYYSGLPILSKALQCECLECLAQWKEGYKLAKNV